MIVQSRITILELNTKELAVKSRLVFNAPFIFEFFHISSHHSHEVVVFAVFAVVSGGEEVVLIRQLLHVAAQLLSLLVQLKRNAKQ